MTLVIDPKTEKGKTQMETIKWCEDTINDVLARYIDGKYLLLKGIQLEFELNKEGQLAQVEVRHLGPLTRDELANAMQEVKGNFVERLEEVKDGAN